eukprot:2552900-Amphidinium_carterae.1
MARIGEVCPWQCPQCPAHDIVVMAMSASAPAKSTNDTSNNLDDVKQICMSTNRNLPPKKLRPSLPMQP